MSSRNRKTQKRCEHLPHDRSDHNWQHSNKKFVPFSFKNRNIKNLLSDRLSDIRSEKDGAAGFEDDCQNTSRLHWDCFWTDSGSERVCNVICSDSEGQNESDYEWSNDDIRRSWIILEKTTFTFRRLNFRDFFKKTYWSEKHWSKKQSCWSGLVK